MYHWRTELFEVVDTLWSLLRFVRCLHDGCYTPHMVQGGGVPVPAKYDAVRSRVEMHAVRTPAIHAVHTGRRCPRCQDDTRETASASTTQLVPVVIGSRILSLT